MKHAKALAFATLLSVSLATVPAWAGPIHSRQGRQRERIHRGVEEGSLTKGERQRLNVEQRAINRARDRALSDGTISGKEAKSLTRMQNHASKDIYRMKHNGRARPQE
ncbi:MAG: hypothetical protein HYZ50_14670 [Deltaproteobacteria bacterium]|nr:hypothetical protein [Deltaproteobacteria bacterium]